jgi:uncharacterized protein involved in exopolysaccharide biosynthesis
LTEQPHEIYVQEGIDALTLLTPLIEKRRQIILGVILVAVAVGIWALLSPRKYKAEMSITPVTSTRSAQGALGGIAALAGATIQTGYQLTPARMVELIKSRSVLGGVGLSSVPPNTRVIDRVLDTRYENDDAESVAKQMSKILTVGANKETGTITLSIAHKDSALARIIAARIVDSASHIFVRTSKAQAQQLRVAQEGRVANAAQQLTAAEERLREFNFGNRATPSFSVAGTERDRLERQIRLAEQVYTQAMTERDAAFGRELEATPTVVVQDPLPAELPKVRKRVIMKTVIASLVSAVVLCAVVLISDLIRRRLEREDSESERFRGAISTLPGIRRKKSRAV